MRPEGVPGEIMSFADCQDLDNYLADNLSADAKARFTAHLVDCDRCRDAVDQQRWIDGLLRSPLVMDLETPPGALVACIRARQSQRRRQTRLIACGLAAAAAMVVAVGWTVKLNRQARGITNAKTASAVLTRAEIEPSLANAEHPRATVVGGKDVLIVPIESQHPNVTVVRVYPSYRPVYATHSRSPAPASTDEFLWNDDLNGG
jgi:hypothetical protein